MNSLLDKLKKTSKNSKTTLRGSDGQLQTTNRNELNQLSADRGLAGAPTSPLAAQLLGANPDAAKMAGTPQQKAKALNPLIDPNSNLQTVQRRQQARTQATAAEQFSYEKSETLQQAGAIGDSVYNLVSSYLPQQAEATQNTNSAYEVALSDDIASQLDDATRQELEQLALNPTQEAAAALAPKLEALGITGAAANPLNYINVKDSGQSVADAVLDYDQVTVGELYANADLASEIGLSQQEFTDLLGVDSTELQNMTVTELQERIEQVEQEEFNKIEDLRSIATSSDSSVSERQQARELLRDSGAVGTVASEENVNKLVQEISDANTIQFGDEVYTVEEFLGDENISGLVSEYLASSDEDKASITERFGADFTNFINSHQTLLEEAADSLETSNSNLIEIQDQNSALGDIEGIGRLSDESLSALIPGYGSFQGELLEKPAVLQVLDILPDAQKVALYNSLTNASPAVLEQIRELTVDELKDLGALDNTDQFQGQVAAWDMLSLISDLDPENTLEAEQLVRTILDGQDIEEVEALVAQSAALGSDDPFLSVLDSDSDGRIDDASILQENYKSYLEEGKDGRTPQIEAPAEYQNVLSEIGDLLADGDLTSEEILDTIEEGDQEQQMAILDAINLNPDLAAGVGSELSSQLTDIISRQFAAPVWGRTHTADVQLRYGNYWSVDVGTIQSEINQLRDSVDKYPFLDSSQIQSQINYLSGLSSKASSQQAIESQLQEHVVTAASYSISSRGDSGYSRQGIVSLSGADNSRLTDAQKIKANQEWATQLMRSGEYTLDELKEVIYTTFRRGI